MSMFGDTQVTNDIIPETPIVQPVVDRSGEIMGNALSNAFNAFGNIVGDARANQKLEASNRILENYRMNMVNIANSVDQGSITLQEAGTRRRQLYTSTLANNPGIGSELDKIDTKIVGENGIAHLVQEGTVEQQAELNIRKTALEAGWASVDAYKEHLASQTRLTQLTTNVDITEQVDEQRKFEVQTAVRDLAKTARPWFDARYQEAVQMAEAGDPQGAYAYLQDQLVTARMDAYGKIGEDADMAWVFKPMEEAITHFQKYTTGEYSTEVFEKQIANTKAKEKAALLTVDPEVGRIIVAQETLGTNFQVLLPQINPRVIKKISGYMSGNESVEEIPNPYSDGKVGNQNRRDNETSFSVIKDQMKDVNNGDAGELGKQQVGQTMNNVMQSMGDNSGFVKNPRQMKAAVDFLADPEVNKFATQNGIPSESADEVKEVLRLHYEGPLIDAVQDKWDGNDVAHPMADLQNAQASAAGVGAGSDQPAIPQGKIKDFVDVMWDGDGIRFVPKPEFAKGSPQFKRYVDNLNRGEESLAAPINKAIRATATAYGTDNFKEVWETKLKDRFFPEEAVEEKGEVGPDEGLDDFNEPDTPPAKKEEAQETLDGGKSTDKPKEQITSLEPQADAVFANISTAEGTKQTEDPYSTTLGYGAFIEGGERDLTKLTMSEVDALQSEILNNPKNNTGGSPVGKYQVVQRTLRDAKKALGIKDTDLFTREVQDKIGMWLLNRRGYEDWKAGNISDAQFKKNMQNEWHALKVRPEFMDKILASKNDIQPVSPKHEVADDADEVVASKPEMRKAMQEEDAPKPKGLAALDRGGGAVREGRVVYKHKNQVANMKPELRKNIADTAEALGMDLIVKSGYRDPETNKRVGGAKLSQHMLGGAADISIAGMPTEQRVALVRELIKRGAKRVGVYSGNTGLHVDYGTAGLDGKKKAHFMFNKYNRNMGSAPSWWKELEEEFK